MKTKGILLYFALIIPNIFSMDKPQQLSNEERKVLKAALNERYEDNFYNTKNNAKLEQFIQLANRARSDEYMLTWISRVIKKAAGEKGNKGNKDFAKKAIDDFIYNARTTIENRALRKAPNPVPAIVKAPAPAKQASVIVIKEMSLAENRVKRSIKGLSNSKDLSNYFKIQSDKNLEAEYLFANSAMYDDEWVNELKNESGIPAIKVKALLEEIRQQIGQLLAEHGYKNYAEHFKKKEKPANGPWPEYPESPR